MDQNQAAKKAGVDEYTARHNEAEKEVEEIKIKLCTATQKQKEKLIKRRNELLVHMSEIRGVLSALGAPIPGHI